MSSFSIKNDLIRIDETLQSNRLLNIATMISQNKNIKVGIAIKPNTNVEVLKPYIDKIDLVLIMSVEPGYGGQKFIEKTIEKITKIRNMKKNIIISMDGGINKDNINKIKEKEVDMCVIGSYITKSNIKEKIMELKSLQ